MSAGMRAGWGVVALAWGVGSWAEADTMSGAGFLSGGASSANLATDSPSWKASTRSRLATDGVSNLFPDHSMRAAPVAVPPAPAPVVPPNAPAAPVIAPAPAAAPTPAARVPAYAPPAQAPVAVQTTPSRADAFVNLGNGPYPEASLITNGNSQPWANSSQIAPFFGGQPDARQQADFNAAVMHRVQQTFQNSGVSASITGIPGVPADHTLSLVSNTSAQLLPSAIGMTDVGGNGFSFIDQEARSAGSLDQLEWIVAHNVSHELMLALGVGENYDTTGHFIDARNATLSMMLDPGAKFSPDAASALNQALAAENAPGTTAATAAQVLEAQTVPEPGTLAVWAAGALAVAFRLFAGGRKTARGPV